MYHIIGLICIAVFTGLLFLINKKVKKTETAGKVLSIVFAAVFVARYYSYLEYPIDNIFALSGGGERKVATFFSLFLG